MLLGRRRGVIKILSNRAYGSMLRTISRPGDDVGSAGMGTDVLLAEVGRAVVLLCSSLLGKVLVKSLD